MYSYGSAKVVTDDDFCLLQWTVHNPYFNYFNPEAGFSVNNNESDTTSWPLETYLPDDYIKHVMALYGTNGFGGKTRMIVKLFI